MSSLPESYDSFADAVMKVTADIDNFNEMMTQQMQTVIDLQGRITEMTEAIAFENLRANPPTIEEYPG